MYGEAIYSYVSQNNIMATMNPLSCLLHFFFIICGLRFAALTHLDSKTLRFDHNMSTIIVAALICLVIHS